MTDVGYSKYYYIAVSLLTALLISTGWNSPLIAQSLGSLLENHTHNHEHAVKYTDPGSTRAQFGRVLTYSPLLLRGGSQLTLISPKLWTPTVERLSRALRSTHNQFQNHFGKIPIFKSSIRLMEEENFYETTGAPRWTNAMFYRGQIMIPISSSEPTDFSELFRSVKHEYTHAVIHSLSAGKCPGWIDEGLAQWAEEKANPALKPALYRWLKRNDPVPLKLLQGGFTRLASEMVPAAYAQSLFASNTIIQRYGFDKLQSYFENLREQGSKKIAFRKAFGISEKDFEKVLEQELRHWADRYSKARKVSTSY